MSQQLRRRYEHVKSLEDRLTEEAKRLREEAELLLLLRAQVLRKARNARDHGAFARDIEGRGPQDRASDPISR